tara:strand:- start:1723 stop:2418 length:696 start_codon:yes stop_codon:yes gene_type:complete
MTNDLTLSDDGVPTNFVNNLMESMYGKESMGDIKTEEHPDNDETVAKHAEAMGENFGLPTDIGNGWKAPAQIQDHQEVEADVEPIVETKTTDMESRVIALEESLSTLLESLQTLISEGYGGGKKMMKEDEKGNVSMNPGKKFIEKRENLAKKPKTVKISGETVDVGHVTSGLAATPAGRAKKNELEMRAAAQELDKKKPRNKKGQALSKKEMAELTADYKKQDEEGEEEES